MLYSKGVVRIQDRTKVQGGSLRGEDTVTVGMNAQVKGDLFGKTAALLDGANIQGSVTTSGTLTRSNSAVVSGTITQNTALAPCILSEEPTISYGTADKTVPWDSLNTVLPGSYRDLLVHSRGTVSLQPGVYNFRKFALEPDAKILIQAGGEVSIHVQDQAFLDDRIVMTSSDPGRSPNIRLYSNQTSFFQVGHDCKLFGTFIAPKAELHILDRAAIQGRILANKVTLDLDVIVSNSLDTDGDGIPDLVESLMGTDPYNASSKPVVGTPSQWFVDPTLSNSVVYNYSPFQGYTNRSSVAVVYPPGTLASGLVPVVTIQDTPAPAIPSPSIPNGWTKTGRYFEVKGDVRPGEKVLFGFPLPSSASTSLTPPSLVVRHFSNGEWLYEPVESVSNGVAYAYVRSFSPFFIMQNTASNPVIYLDCGFTEDFVPMNPPSGTGTSWATAYTTLDSALKDASVSKKEIWVAGDTYGDHYYYHWGEYGTAWKWVDGIRIYGGFAGNETSRDQRNPQSIRSVLSPGYVQVQSSGKYYSKYVNDWRISEFLTSGSVYIDGVIFGYYNFFGTKSSSSLDGLGLLQHHGNMTLRECSFMDLAGNPSSAASIWGGAIRLTGHDAVLTLDSCAFLRCSMPARGGALAVEPRTTAIISKTLFQNNSITSSLNVGGGAILNKGNLIVKSSIFKDNAAILGAAIYAIPDSLTAPIISIENCLFQGNQSRSGILYTDSAATASLTNCTFAGNSSYTPNGGALYANKSSVIRMKNSILWGNLRFVSTDYVPGEIYTAPGGKIYANHCDVKRGISGPLVMGDPVIDEGGNIGSDTVLHNPKFFNPSSAAGSDSLFFTSDDGLQLGDVSSGVIDKGDATLQPPVDILGQARASRHSLGAYEFIHFPPAVAITYPGRDTAINTRVLTVRYKIDGVEYTRTDSLNEGSNRIIISKATFGLTGSDTLLVNVDITPPAISITYPGRDTAVTTTPILVRYSVDGVSFSRTVNLNQGVNQVVVSEIDSVGNQATSIRKIYYSTGSIAPVVAKAKARDTVFTYDLFTLDAKESSGPSGVTLTYAWKQILGTSVYINTPSSRVAGVVSRGQNRLRFELTVSDSSGFFSSAKDTVTVEVLEPVNALEYAQALETAKSNQDGAFALSIDPSGEGSRYTLDNSLRLQGFLTGTSGTLGTIRWTCNARTGTFQPLGQNWDSPAISLDPGDNWITLIYTQGSQIATDRILVSRGEVDMTGFDLNPNVLWADSAMSFKLVVNVDDPAISNVHLVRITNQELDLGELVDNGTGGDGFASDRRYTLQFNLTPNEDSIYWFRVRANKSGVNSYSAIYTFYPQQRYNPTTFQNILAVQSGASALFDALKANRSERSAMDSVANWLIEQPDVDAAGIGPGEKAICWQYTSGIHAMISNAPAGTRGGGKIKTKALSPYQFDGPFQAYDDGITGYRGAIIPAARIDTALYAADSLVMDSNMTDSNLTMDHWKNWGGYKAVMVATHGNTFGYDSLSQIRRKPTQDGTTGQSNWAKPYIAILSHVHADTNSGSRYWNDLTSGGKKGVPRLILAKILGRIDYGITAKFFATYDKNMSGTLVSLGACRTLFNNNLWDAIRKNGDAKTALIGYTDYVNGSFAGKSAEIIFKSLVKGKTLKQSIDSVVTFCGKAGNGICFVNKGKAWDSTAYLEIRGDSNYTLVPQKGRVWAWESGNGSAYSCAASSADTVPAIKNITNVSAGFGHGLALDVSGTVWGWGWNGSGQLGIAPSGGAGSVPSTNYTNCQPIRVFPGSGYKNISAGAGKTLAVDSIGRVWKAGEFTGSASIGWTHDSFGNTWAAGVVGVSPQVDTIAGLSNIVAVSGGGRHSLALDAFGNVWAWGENTSGELGLGDTLPRMAPSKVPGLPKIVAITAGSGYPGFSSHSLALDQAGKLWAWGRNVEGQLGTGDTVNKSSPQLVPGLAHIKTISAGTFGSSAIDSSGNLWSWGLNDQGQLSLGNTLNQKSPVQVPGISGALSVSHGIFPVILDGSGNAKWSCGSACGNTYISKKSGSMSVGAGGDEFGLSIAP